MGRGEISGDSPELLRSEYAVKLYGQGHVVAFNYFGNWHDAGIERSDLRTTRRQSPPRKLPIASRVDRLLQQRFYNMGDNCMEADGGAHNIRLFRAAASTPRVPRSAPSPWWGRPVVRLPERRLQRPTFGACKVWPAAGILIYQNTFVGECTSRYATNLNSEVSR